jgi:hypothetical protein
VSGDIKTEQMADLPDYAAKYSVAGGQSAVPLSYTGTSGTAVFITGPPMGTVIMIQ